MGLDVEAARAESFDAKEATATSGTFNRVLTDIRLLLIALWLGAAVFFSAVVAPSVFIVLRGAKLPQANHLAGSIVTRTLGIINTGGFIISLLLLATAFLFRETIKRRAFIAELTALAWVAIMTGVGQWYIAARMLALRAAMGKPIDEVNMEDPLRAAFDSLHGLSVTALGLGMLAALIALLMIARRGRANSL